MRPSLFVFDRDLRLGDHAGLADAARRGPVIPAVVVDPRRLATLARNPRRAAYYCGAVQSLARDLDARGTRLICRRGSVPATVLALAREAGAAGVTWSIGYGAAAQREGRALQSVLEEAGLRATMVHDAPAVPPEETAAARTSDGGRGYKSLSAYFAVWMSQPRAPQTGPIFFAKPDVATDPLPSPLEWNGQASPAEVPSEARARAALEAYLSNAVLQYRSARKLPAGEPTSHLSAALSFGLIAARSVLAAIDARARDPFLLAEEKSSLDAFRYALVCRDFFLQLAWFFEEKPDLALQSRMRAFPFAATHPALESWREGRTGYPLVDAGMRELRATGWMHPRVRQVAASFLCFDLGVDWRVGRDAWDDELVEDDPALAVGNWQWVAGVGADLAQFPRIYNPRKQARSIDPGGTYVRRWIPELANVPDADLFDTAAAARRAQLSLPLFEGGGYQTPVLDHEAAARAFLAQYAKFVSAG